MGLETDATELEDLASRAGPDDRYMVARVIRVARRARTLFSDLYSRVTALESAAEATNAEVRLSDLEARVQALEDAKSGGA